MTLSTQRPDQTHDHPDDRAHDRAVPDSPRTIRVLSVPASQVYIRHLAHPDGADGVVRLPDAMPSPDKPQSPWWPPASLEPAWVEENADAFDLVHVHFGFDARTPEQLAEWTATLRRLGKPLVYTVHDLRNPHHKDATVHNRQLDVLVRDAAAVVTLTQGASVEIARRWGRRATVLPHPHVVPLPLVGAPRPHRVRPVVGVHLKSIRANMAPYAVVDALVDAVADRPEAVLRVNVHDEVMDRASSHHDAAIAAFLREHEAAGHLELDVHPYYADENDLWAYFRSIDLSVLPYRFGTHSGWLEACYDLGTPVLAPDCGYYADQRPCLSYHHDERGLDVESLRAAVHRAIDERPRWIADPGQRLRERRMLAAAHRELFDGLLT